MCFGFDCFEYVVVLVVYGDYDDVGLWIDF